MTAVNEGTSLSGVQNGGSYTGTAVDFNTGTTFYANLCMAVTVASYAGSGAIEVELQASHDDSNWVVLGTVELTADGTVGLGHNGFAAAYLRAVITYWDSGVTGGSVSATVAGC